MSSRHRYAEELSGAVQAANPFFHPVSVPKAGLFRAAVEPPDLYPQDAPKRGYYVPVPPPAPFGVDGSEYPTLIGEHGGRQWSVHILANDDPKDPSTPTLGVRSYLRLLPNETVPFPVLPWVVASPSPEPPTKRSFRGTNMPLFLARAGIARASQMTGRPIVPARRPPLQNAVVFEAWDVAARSFLESPKFVEAYGRWEQRAMSLPAEYGSAFPSFHCWGDEFAFYTGFGRASPVSEHARTVTEVLELASDLERTTSGRDAAVDPIPTVTFRDPPGSVPDVRRAHRCPQCGQLEIVRVAVDPATKLRHIRTLRCGVDVYPASGAGGSAELGMGGLGQGP